MVSKLSKTSNIFDIDDEKLIDKFVQGSNQLLSSDNIRLEVNGSLSQLISRSGEPIAIGYLQSKPRTIVVKDDSRFLESLNSTLQNHDFVLIGAAKQPGFIEYRHYVTPAGYKVWYTEPAILWKKWWPTERFQNKQRFNMDILVSFKDNWYPVQDISVNAGIFTIKTIAGQMRLQRQDRVLWLAQKLTNDSPKLNHDNSLNLDQNSPNPPFTSADTHRFLGSSKTSLTGLKSLEKSKLVAEKEQNIAELEQRIQAEISARLDLEEKLNQAEQRALIAEQRLQIAYKYLHQLGISPQDMYIRKS
jgi:hypothetical protein